MKKTILIKQSAEAFWTAFASMFPEVTSGDSQLAGEDAAALSLWAWGSTNGEPDQVIYVPVDWVSKRRIDAALTVCMSTAALILFNGTVVPTVPQLTVDLLRSCICHVLHFNQPS